MNKWRGAISIQGLDVDVSVTVNHTIRQGIHSWRGHISGGIESPAVVADFFREVMAGKRTGKLKTSIGTILLTSFGGNTVAFQGNGVPKGTLAEYLGIKNSS